MEKIVSKNDKKFYGILISLLVIGAISWWLYFKTYQDTDTVDIKTFPMTIGTWTGTDMPLTDVEYAVLETRNVFIRRYKRFASPDMYLFIVYSQNNRKVSHPPEICYTGSGVSILGKTSDFVDVENPRVRLDVNLLDMETRDISHMAFYWFKVGNSFTPNYWKQQFLIAVKTLFGQPASSALIRVSADVVDGDKEKTRGQIKEFVQQITPYLFQYLP